MKKYYNYETQFIRLADELSAFLKLNKIYYERSGAYSYYHFEIKADPAEVELINNWLDNNTIINK